MVGKKFYNMGRDSLIMRWLYEDETVMVLIEVHEDIYRSLIRSLTQKLLRVDYYWLTLMKDEM